MTKSKFVGIGLCILLICLVSSSRAQIAEDEELSPNGWLLPTIGTGIGDWSASVGLFAWSDRADPVSYTHLTLPTTPYV